VKKVLFQGETEFADVEILDTYGYGKILAIDGWTQSAQDDEVMYHEALVCPAMTLLERPARKVAILGGGEGATLREVLRFPSVERCAMVDIDPELVALCKEHLPEWHAGAFDDARGEVIAADARAWLAASGEKFDVILADLPDCSFGEPLQDLYSTRFYEIVAEHLAPGGLFVTQSVDALALGTNLVQTPVIRRTVRHVFGHAHVYARYIPSFWSEWTWVMAGPGIERLPLSPGAYPDPADVAAEEIDARLAARRDARFPCKTYDGVSHRHLFSLMRDLREVLRWDGPIVRDLEEGQAADPERPRR
jgi:spermidine synthase